ncbi:hypothetical protein MMC22_000585 [Lobaria immixta]|nr:hypothetical protein [Lobaria immixta]
MTITMPPAPNKNDMVATWAFVEVGVREILNNLREGLDMATYMGIYTAVFNFCTAKKPESLVNGSILTADNVHGGVVLSGEDLYTNLKNHLTKLVAEIHENSKSHVDEALLSYYVQEWDRYTTAAKYTNHAFGYLNRHWVMREIAAGKRDTYDVYTLYLVQWREELFTKLNLNVMAAVLKIIEKQRMGQTIEQSQIKSVADSFISLGLDTTDRTRSTPTLYQSHFEKPLLEATTRYYENESAQFLMENSVIEYMKKAEIWLNEEKGRVGLYLHPEILNPLMTACLGALVNDHSGLIRDEFQELLDHNQQDDLALMHRLLVRIDGLEPLPTKFEAHVRKSGLAAVERVAAESENLEPKMYVDALFVTHVHYQQLVDDSFSRDSKFVRSLDNACTEFFNRNKVCTTGSTRSPELLAKYTDMLLKKGETNAEEADLETALTKVITVFKYIEDKDVFQDFYTRMLAKRLINSSSASEDAETSMISKLNGICGFEFTNKLQRMLQDIKVSKDLNIKYNDSRGKASDGEEAKKAINSNFHILNTGFWPLTQPETTFMPPPEIVDAYTDFQKIYLDQHSGRKLTWLWNLCKGEMRANYIKNAKTPYTFMVSTYQMAILLLFNDADVVTYEQARNATMLSADWLDPSLGILVKAKVLKPSPNDGKPEPGTSYTLNHGFKSKRLKVNLNISLKSEQKKDVEDTHKAVEDDRKMQLQSTIVRIMKSRQKLKYFELVQETISQVNSRFEPKIPEIKKTIDQLIDMEYIDRLENEELEYIA